MRVTGLRVIVLSAPLERPVRTSFGAMASRNSILVEVETDEGLTGIGESWCNFPSWAPVERRATLEQGIAPLLLGRDCGDPAAVTAALLRSLDRLALQWGARGPIYQAVSAVDIALWDILGQREGQPIYRLLGSGDAVDALPVYASGLGPDEVVEMAAPLWRRGVRTLKLKVGFGLERDRANLEALRAAYPGAGIAVDANQAWEYDDAVAFAPLLEEFGCRWMEEPVAADRLEALGRLQRELPCPVAGGENYYGPAEFDHVLRAGALGLAQPDVGKTGGISQAAAICRHAVDLGVPYAPHFLGSAVGLVASLHLLAAIPGGTLMEFDANPNPLREALLNAPLEIVDGSVALPQGPGLGIRLDPAVVARYAVTG